MQKRIHGANCAVLLRTANATQQLQQTCNYQFKKITSHNSYDDNAKKNTATAHISKITSNNNGNAVNNKNFAEHKQFTMLSGVAMDADHEFSSSSVERQTPTPEKTRENSVTTGLSSQRSHVHTGDANTNTGAVSSSTAITTQLSLQHRNNSPGSYSEAGFPNAVGFMSTAALEQYRLQLYNYALSIERLRCPQYSAAAAIAAAAAYSNSGNIVAGTPGANVVYPNNSSAYMPSGGRLALSMSLFPQRLFQPEEPKPQHSYIGLIAMAILSSAESKLVLSDIYQYILDNYPYFRTRGPGWRNSIRHNLSLNDCFIKSGRSANGKGHYWAIHPANMEDFRKGDFRRRKAQRKVRKHMGLSVDDAGTDSPSPPPLDLTSPPPSLPPHQMSTAHHLAAAAAAHSHGFGYALHHPPTSLQRQLHHQHYIERASLVPQFTNQVENIRPIVALNSSQTNINNNHQQAQQHHQHLNTAYANNQLAIINETTTTTASVIANLYSQSRKRQFDVASLLAPDVKVVDIVTDNDAIDRCTPTGITTTQHTVITKVSVQRQQHHHQRHMPYHRSTPHMAHPRPDYPHQQQEASEHSVIDLDDQEDIDVVASDVDVEDHIHDTDDFDSQLDNEHDSSLDAANSSGRQSPAPSSDTTTDLHTLKNQGHENGEYTTLNPPTALYETHSNSLSSSHQDYPDHYSVTTSNHSPSHVQQDQSVQRLVHHLHPNNSEMDSHIFGQYYGSYMATARRMNNRRISVTQQPQSEQSSK